MDTAGLAEACQSLAEDLDNEQVALNYTGPQAITLGKLSSNLSAQASSLRTLVVADAINKSAQAVQAVKNGTTAINTAVKKLQDAGKAIKIAGLVLSLCGSIISENPGSVIANAQNLINAVSDIV
jgi:hypothetical protein